MGQRQSTDWRARNDSHRQSQDDEGLQLAAGAWIVKDDYDAEYRFGGQPLPSLQSVDRRHRVVLLGSFNKVLFSSLRIGYMVLPPALVDDILRLRYTIDRGVASVTQAVLADFIDGGYLARHIRKTRKPYAERLSVLRGAAARYLNGALHIPAIDAGLVTPAFYDGITPRETSRQPPTRARCRGAGARSLRPPKAAAAGSVRPACSRVCPDRAAIPLRSG